MEKENKRKRRRNKKERKKRRARRAQGEDEIVANKNKKGGKFKTVAEDLFFLK